MAMMRRWRIGHPGQGFGKAPSEDRAILQIRIHGRGGQGVVIFFGMATLSSVIKRDLTQMGKFLFIGMVMLLVAMIANFFIQSSALMITLSVLAIGIFSLFILHDLKRVQDGLETNYISATLGVYLSIYNVFSNLLALLGIFGGDD